MRLRKYLSAAEICPLLLALVLPIKCSSLLAFTPGQSLLGVFIDREGFGKLGKVSENFTIVNLETGSEHASNAWTMGGTTRNNEPFSIAIVPPGMYRISSIGLSRSTFICAEDCPTFKLDAGKVYFSGGYALDITNNLLKITHSFKIFEPTRNVAETENFRDYIQKYGKAWVEGQTIEHVKIFMAESFTRTRATM